MWDNFPMTPAIAQVIETELHSAYGRSVFGHPVGEVIHLGYAFESADMQVQ